ncbi:hypothetical protein GQ54DRAFT_299472 [Martensiomyces pterosporus]|nr:hypothetical protein GQ54DRAFT_299472 [Martensiomyces pterosporus]
MALQNSDQSREEEQQKHAQSADYIQEPSGPAGIAQGLSDTAQNIGASLQAMQGALISNMQQAAQMTMSMNMMMEELVKRALQISVIACPLEQEESGSPRYQTVLDIKVRNRSPIPLVDMAVKLHFAPVSPLACPVNLSLNAVPQSNSGTRAQTAGSGRGQLVFSDVAKTLDEQRCKDDSPFAESTPTVLASGAEAAAQVALGIDALEQLSSQISVEFVSPGTGKSLVVTQRFGIRLLNLVGCRFVSAAGVKELEQLDEVPGVDAISVDVRSMRELFAVPPADGVGVGSVFVLNIDEAAQLGLRVHGIAADALTAQCTWVAAGSGRADVDAIRLKVASELSSRAR